jgi:hypothetical protein
VNTPPSGSFALHLLDVGQGEAILLDFPNGAFALLDAGPPSAKEIVLRAVAARKDREFRFGGFTHWDKDHIGALPEVLRARAPLELVRPRGDLGLIKKLCARLNDKDVPRQIDEMNELEGKIDVRDLGARQEIPDVGSGVEIHSLAPGKTARARLAQAVDTKSAHRMSMNLEQIRNDVSLVLWLHVFGRTLLLSGEVLRLRIVALRLDAQNQLLQFHDRRREFVHADREAPPIRPVRGRLLRLPLHRPRLQQPAHPRSPRAAGRLVHRARRPGSWS